MDNRQFDDLARGFSTGMSRRTFLKVLVGGAASSVLAMLGIRSQADELLTSGQELSTVYLPIVLNGQGETCSEISICGDRKYCSEDQNCICIKSAEGNLLCGKLPRTCYMPLCQTSAGCAILGEGYFCDTPNSGCCTDPPAELPRCIASCNSPCPAGRSCGDTCCPRSQLCINGGCTSCTEDRVCGSTCCPMGEMCINGECKPDPTGCPSCGKCTGCEIDGECYSYCPINCTAGTLCRLASMADDYQKLRTYLDSKGFVALPDDPQATVFAYNWEPVRSALGLQFTEISGSTATLVYKVEATGQRTSYAVVFPSAGEIYGLYVDSSGVVREVTVPPDALNSQQMRTTEEVITDTWSNNASVLDYPNIDTTAKCRECMIVCKTAAGIECGLIGALICVGTGPGAVICAAVLGSLCSSLSDELGCLEFCDSMLAPSLEGDLFNCGACGKACLDPNNQCCNGTCSDRLTDSENCGGCGKACPPGQMCCQGRCEKPEECCPYPQTPCEGYCCPDPVCAPEGGCCPKIRLCSGGLQCCEAGQSCIVRSDGSSFCCSATQACQDGGFGELKVCCPDGQSCKCGLGGCSCQ
jgi:hypothetical protein